jgi:Restriction endonuclease
MSELQRMHSADPGTDLPDEDTTWTDLLLAGLHKLSPEAFEEFCLYLLRLFGLELTRRDGSGDEGIDGIGTAPLSEVLSATVAVQVKRSSCRQQFFLRPASGRHHFGRYAFPGPPRIRFGGSTSQLSEVGT